MPAWCVDGAGYALNLAVRFHEGCNLIATLDQLSLTKWFGIVDLELGSIRRMENGPASSGSDWYRACSASLQSVAGHQHSLLLLKMNH